VAFSFAEAERVPRKTVPDAAETTLLLEQRIRGVFRHLPKALAGEAEEIHQMRVAGRRLRVMLPLLAPGPERRVRRATRLLRALTRAAGLSRDLDVILELLERRLGELPASAERRRLVARLRGARTRSRTRMADLLLDLEIARLRRDLRRVLGAGADTLFGVFRRIREARDARGGRLLSLLAGLGDGFDPEGLHHVRIRARKLRYMAELSEQLRGEPAEASTLLKALQDELGYIHDAHVLASWLERQRASALRRGQHELAEEAGRLAAWFDGASREAHRRYLEEAPVQRVERALAGMGGSRSAA
jgi:CHAD domain-containing protein